MSARQPFVPSGIAARPPSRATARNTPSNQPKPSFVPDRSNALHSNASAADKNVDTTISATASLSMVSVTQPLNLQNLMTKKKPLGTHKLPSRRDSIPDNMKDRPITAFPRRINTSTPKIHAPRPLLPPQAGSPLFDPNTTDSGAGEPKDAHTLNSFSQTDAFSSPDHSKVSSARISHKRTRNDFDDFDDDSFAYEAAYANAKRYKVDEGSIKYPGGNFSPGRMSSPLAQSHHTDYQPSPQQRGFDRPNFSGDNSQYEQHTQSQGQNSQSQGDGAALTKLLGRDADLYVEEHMENYDILTEKWKNCTMDEWVAGADGIMSKYGKILDFVKDHMTAKLKLFATFDKQVDAHNGVLDDRKKVLAGVKQRLVKESGSILGGPKTF